MHTIKIKKKNPACPTCMQFCNYLLQSSTAAGGEAVRVRRGHHRPTHPHFLPPFPRFQIKLKTGAGGRPAAFWSGAGGACAGGNAWLICGLCDRLCCQQQAALADKRRSGGASYPELSRLLSVPASPQRCCAGVTATHCERDCRNPSGQL